MINETFGCEDRCSYSDITANETSAVLIQFCTRTKSKYDGINKMADELCTADLRILGKNYVMGLAFSTQDTSKKG